MDNPYQPTEDVHEARVPKRLSTGVVSAMLLVSTVVTIGLILAAFRNVTIVQEPGHVIAVDWNLIRFSLAPGVFAASSACWLTIRLLMIRRFLLAICAALVAVLISVLVVGIWYEYTFHR